MKPKDLPSVGQLRYQGGGWQTITKNKIKKKQNNSVRASAFQITFAVALISVFAILPTHTEKLFGQEPLRFQPETVLTPTLGNYPPTSIALSTDTTVMPDAAPTGTTSINVSSSTNFKGGLEGYPTTGVVRVTDPHPAGTYMVTVRAFDSGGASVTKTFTLTVTTPAACTPLALQQCQTSPLALNLCRKRWAISTAMASKTSPLPT